MGRYEDMDRKLQRLILRLGFVETCPKVALACDGKIAANSVVLSRMLHSDRRREDVSASQVSLIYRPAQ